MAVQLRKAGKDDAAVIMELVKELATFEKLPEGVQLTVETLRKDLERNALEAVLLLEGEEVAGLLSYNWVYSTWVGQCMYMDDLFVRPEYRGKGYGQILFKHAGKIAFESKCARMQWHVLDWNKTAIKFYHQVPVTDVTTTEGWLEFQLDSVGIRQLAAL